MRPKKHTLKVPQQDGFVPISKALADLPGPLKALCKSSPQALHHFTQADQIDQLIKARESDPDIGFMTRLLTLCSLPRTNPGPQKEYVRCNGPYTLIVTAGYPHKLPFGNIPRLLLAWVCTEAVRTQSRDLILGKSLSKFMRTLGLKPVGGVRTRLRNQMKRLFNSSVRLVYKDKHVERFASSAIASQGEFWWDPKRPDEPVLWDSRIHLGEEFFNEIIRHPVPIDMNILKALKRSTLGLDLYLWLSYRTFSLKGPLRLSWRQLYRQFGAEAAKASDKDTVQNFRKKVLRELVKIKGAWPSLNYATARGVLMLLPSKPVIPSA